MTTPHLDDEALSAAFDGEASADEQAHLHGCALCRAGLDHMAEVARAVGAPVPLRPARDVAASISRAIGARTELSEATGRLPDGAQASLAAAAETTDPAMPGLSGPRPAPAAADETRPPGLSGPRPSVPGGPAAGSPGPRPAAWGGRLTEAPGARPDRDQEARRKKAPGWWLGAAGGIAAAVLVVVGLVALLHRAGSQSRLTTSAVAPTTLAAGGSSAPAATGTNGADLGDQSNAVTLGREIRDRLASRSAGASAKPAPGGAVAPGAGPASTPAAALTPGGTGPSSTAAGIAPPNPPCAGQGAAAAGLATSPTPPLVFSGSLRWQGQPAVVLVYSGPAALAGVVMRMADCARLAAVPL
jgi:hypothetical protein